MNYNFRCLGGGGPRLRISGWFALTLLTAAVALMALALPSGAQTLTTLYQFTGGSDGAAPSYGSLIQASDGNLYGTTLLGGNAISTHPYSWGTVFRIATSGAFTSLYQFTGGNDQGQPYGGLIQASDGNLYGMTYANYFGAGTVYQITPSGALTTLYSFAGLYDGAWPYGSLIEASDGNLYGMSSQGGYGGWGSVFRITTLGALSPLYGFTGNSDGGYPYGSLIQASDGNFYGMTNQGGDYGYGTVFQMTPSGSLGWTYSFTGGNDGATPYGSLIQAGDGNLYGMTEDGGNTSVAPQGAGTVFQITTSGTLGWTYDFTGSSDGANPLGSLIQASDGNLYGMTEDGAYSGVDPYGAGTVFQITLSGILTTLYQFTGGNDGGNPFGGLMQASDGNLYGTTSSGGNTSVLSNGAGTVFQLALSTPLTLTFANPIVTEGSDITGTLTLPGPAPAGGTAITLSGDGSGLTFKNGPTVVVPAGAVSQTFKIATDPTLTSPVSATITATSNGASTSANATVIVMSLSGISLTKSSVTAGYANMGTASIATGASGGGVQVFLSSPTPGITFSPSSIWIDSGQTSSPSFTIFSNVSSFTSPTTVTVTGTLANGSSASAAYTLSPVCQPTLTLSKSACTAGDQITGTISLNVPAPATSQNVALTGQVAGVSYQANLNIPAGHSSGTFTITTSATLASNANTTVTAACNGFSSQQALSVNAEAISSITAAQSSILARGANQITVTVSQPSPQASVNVSLSSNNSGATIQPSYGMGKGATSFTVTLTSSAAAFSSSATVTITASLSNGSSKSVSFTVNPSQTSIAVSSVSGQPGQQVTLPATLTVGGTPLAGAVLSYQVGSGTPFIATTNASGQAAPRYTIPNNPGGTLSITVTYTGIGGYGNSSGSSTLTIQQLPTTLTVSTVSGSSGQQIALSATLTSNGKPLSYVNVIFTVGGGAPFLGSTDASGVASPGYVIPHGAGSSITVAVTYAGNSSYSGSSGTGAITVN